MRSVFHEEWDTDLFLLDMRAEMSFDVPSKTAWTGEKSVQVGNKKHTSCKRDWKNVENTVEKQKY